MLDLGLRGAATLKLRLPWPPSACHPNARGHWAKTAKARKLLRTAWAYQARAQGARKIEADRLRVSLVFVPPDKRRRDLDGCLSAVKAGLDGLADVLGVDDSCWELAIAMDHERIGGVVEIEVAAA